MGEKMGGPEIFQGGGSNSFNVNGEGPENISCFIKLVSIYEKRNCLWVTPIRNALLCSKNFIMQ